MIDVIGVIDVIPPDVIGVSDVIPPGTISLVIWYRGVPKWGGRGGCRIFRRGVHA